MQRAPVSQVYINLVAKILIHEKLGAFMQARALETRDQSFSAIVITRGLVFLFFCGWIPGVLVRSYQGVFDAVDPIFDITLFLASASLAWERRKSEDNGYGTAGLIVLYTIGGGFLAVVLRKVNIYDFLMVYKFTWYLLLLIPFSRSNLLDGPTLQRLMRIALVLFFTIYLIKFSSGQKRPIFFTENNFELLFLCLLTYASHVANKRSEVIDLAMLFGVALLAGSRSGASLAAVTAIFIFDFKKIQQPSTLFILLAIASGTGVAIYTFFERLAGSSMDKIDRVIFYQLFLDSIREWDWWTYFTGAPRITPLPDYVCHQLAFFKNLFSHENNGKCYSVILHSFDLRVLHDHGLIVIAALIYIILKVLSQRSRKEQLCVLALLLINGMSVSSLNSVYGAFGVAMVACASSIQRNREIPSPVNSGGRRLNANR